jgi:plasmid stabilization system protein ParE
VNYRLVVRPEVDADLREAESWYDQQRGGLGAEFQQAVRAAISRLPHSPLLYRVRHRRLQVRWTLPHRFPYRIIYRVMGDMVVIYAVLHAARRDRHWQQRV